MMAVCTLRNWSKPATNRSVGLGAVAVNEVLQASGLRFQERELAVRFTRLAQIAARRGENLRAVPDEGGQDDRDRDIERGDGENAPAYRQGPQPVQRPGRRFGHCGCAIRWQMYQVRPHKSLQP